MKRSRVQKYYHKQRIQSKDNEGVTTETYGEPSFFYGIVWPASGKVQSEMYGERLKYIQNCKVEGTYTIKNEKSRAVYDFGAFTLQENDGICVHVGETEEPDYKVISIKAYTPLRLELEKL